MRRSKTYWPSMVVLAVVISVLAPAVASAAGGGQVMPPQARPYGWSLTDMTLASAYFTTSYNDPMYYPDTPFQVLYWMMDGDINGFFAVRAGTYFYVPVFWFDDTQPMPLPIPATNAEAITYSFDPAWFALKDLQIVVDGEVTPIGPEYLAGPVMAPEPPMAAILCAVDAPGRL